MVVQKTPMKSRYLINIGLILLLAVLFWLNQDRESTPIYPRLTTMPTQTVHTISISRDANEQIELKRVDHQWKIIKPIQTNANETRLKLILSLLSVSSFSQLALSSESAELNKFGISKNSTRILFNDLVFIFGNIEPLSQNRYVYFDKQLHLIDDQVSTLLNANIASFIENRLLDSTQHIISLKLPLLGPEQVLSASSVIITQPDTHWQSEPVTLPTDELTKLIDTWQHAYALQVFPYTHELHHQLMPVEIQLSNQKTKHFLIERASNSVNVFDDTTKLKYVFPISAMETLFPSEVSD
jgi:hypothetical protein